MDTKTHTIERRPEPAPVPRAASWLSRLPNDPAREKRAILVAIIVGIPLLMASGAVGVLAPAVALAMVAAMAAVAINGLIYVRRVPRLLASGLLGGGFAGLVAIGGGLRLAMRIVSLTGGRREMTIEGTMFLLIMGAVFGALVGVLVSGLLRAWTVRGWIVGLALIAFPGSGLILEPETRGELLHDGAGWWLNIPMFYVIWPLFGLLVVPLVARLHQSLPNGPRALAGRRRVPDSSSAID